MHRHCSCTVNDILMNWVAHICSLLINFGACSQTYPHVCFQFSEYLEYTCPHKGGNSSIYMYKRIYIFWRNAWTEIHCLDSNYLFIYLHVLGWTQEFFNFCGDCQFYGWGISQAATRSSHRGKRWILAQNLILAVPETRKYSLKFQRPWQSQRSIH